MRTSFRCKHIIILSVSLLLLSCSKTGLSAEAETAARDVMKSLQKLNAATEVGVNYQQYGSLVIDAKAQMNGASAKLPKRDIKKELEAAMEAYADGASAWTEMIQYDFLLVNFEPGKTLVLKYSIPVSPEKTSVDRKSVLSAIWLAATQHVKRATELLD